MKMDREVGWRSFGALGFILAGAWIALAITQDLGWQLLLAVPVLFASRHFLDRYDRKVAERDQVFAARTTNERNPTSHENP